MYGEPLKVLDDLKKKLSRAVETFIFFKVKIVKKLEFKKYTVPIFRISMENASK